MFNMVLRGPLKRFLGSNSYSAVFLASCDLFFLFYIGLQLIFVTPFSRGAEQITLLLIRSRLPAGVIFVKHRRTRKLFRRKARDVVVRCVGASSQAVFLRDQSSNLSDVQ